MSNKKVYKLIIAAMLAALAFVGTIIQIPLPTGGMVHLGNFFVVLGSLLCGGLVGGIAGGIGCGLYDLVFYGSVFGMIEYFILKFFMGLIVGSLFRLALKRKINYPILLIIIGTIICILTTIVIIGYKFDFIKLSSKINLKLMYIIIVSTLGYIFGLILILFGAFSSKISLLRKAVAFAGAISVVSNIVLEFVVKIIHGYFIDSLDFEASIIKGVSSMPSCILTGVLTMVIIVVIYPLIFKATRKINYLNDIEIEGE